MHDKKKMKHDIIMLMILVLCLICITSLEVEAKCSPLPPTEVEALKEIGKELGKRDWNFEEDPCSNKSSWASPFDTKSEDWPSSMNNVTCSCSFPDETYHVISIILQGQDLPGVLPPSIARLPYLTTLDLNRNYLTGEIPRQWASTKLEHLSVSVNNLPAGSIPSYLGNITTLQYLSLETNRFSGTVPSELGNLVNLTTLVLSANNLTGELPMALTNLTKLIELRISSNSFTGTIAPEFFQSWNHLQKLEIQASGLEGPIPSSISMLKKLTELRISDLNGKGSEFPLLNETTNLTRLMLRSCNLSGRIPDYISAVKSLKMDLSFNRLVGRIPEFKSVQYLYLTNNLLTGPIPDWINSRDWRYFIDISYNNFSEISAQLQSCTGTLNSFKSFTARDNLLSEECLKKYPCGKDHYSLHINCGGEATTIRGTKFEEDADLGGPAKFFSVNIWGFSSTGQFWDKNPTPQDYIAKNASLLTMENSELYTNARLSPLSLTYYARCLGNGIYNVKLHFVEIIIRGNASFYSLGRRVFDVYIQEQLVLKEFDIAKEAQGTDKEVIKKFKAVVKNKTLEIRFHWSGKGTTGSPHKGTYGPLISAISINSDFRPPLGRETKALIVVGASVLCLALLILGILWWQGCLNSKTLRERALRGLDLQTGFFTFKQIKAATNNFDPTNKIGEGGFGPVYKGILSDGTIIAVKQLSSKSKQGNREFVNEIGMISCLQHPNLVRLYGCCIEANQLLLVYEYMENNSLARALFGPEDGPLKLNWRTRQKICLGIAKGLAYLHEESAVKVVHRDIKTTNVLLDQDLNAKISDFGLAKLDEEEKSHISTRIAGTIGYMAPEYALWGCLTYKADVYSFGVVALETVAGKNNMKYRPNENIQCLMDWALVLQQKGNLLELVDPRLGSDFSKKEAIRTIKVALLCANPTAALRPIMSEVVSMLEGRTPVDAVVLDPSIHGDEMTRLRAFEDQFDHITAQGSSPSGSHSLMRSLDGPWTGSSVTTTSSDLYKCSL
ncbi:probable leucine-rich repeat receptor-like serine/threonine-protein kinase At3g14840 isoform X2 [Rosa chinensis]|uniref:probable leucine-rich repeat receptor-like serine/threonine-protein kinase At3g14840 isoform X2 n=1 Tax=Rosa chinensis TaxID=74649 RepID=UPI000D096526|nr:probable leucine-rich repeat receptor-like serine/threonine-protein kinase At3g14840 isoform X2 [Rosa chinensis]